MYHVGNQHPLSPNHERRAAISLLVQQHNRSRRWRREQGRRNRRDGRSGWSQPSPQRGLWKFNIGSGRNCSRDQRAEIRSGQWRQVHEGSTHQPPSWFPSVPVACSDTSTRRFLRPCQWPGLRKRRYFRNIVDRLFQWSIQHHITGRQPVGTGGYAALLRHVAYSWTSLASHLGAVSSSNGRHLHRSAWSPLPSGSTRSRTGDGGRIE